MHAHRLIALLCTQKHHFIFVAMKLLLHYAMKRWKFLIVSGCTCAAFYLPPCTPKYTSDIVLKNPVLILNLYLTVMLVKLFFQIQNVKLVAKRFWCIFFRMLNFRTLEWTLNACSWYNYIVCIDF